MLIFKGAYDIYIYIYIYIWEMVASSCFPQKRPPFFLKMTSSIQPRFPCTCWNSNITPGKWPSQKESSKFQLFFFRGKLAVKLRGCIFFVHSAQRSCLGKRGSPTCRRRTCNICKSWLSVAIVCLPVCALPKREASLEGSSFKDPFDLEVPISGHPRLGCWPVSVFWFQVGVFGLPKVSGFESWSKKVLQVLDFKGVAVCCKPRETPSLHDMIRYIITRPRELTYHTWGKGQFFFPPFVSFWGDMLVSGGVVGLWKGRRTVWRSSVMIQHLLKPRLRLMSSTTTSNPPASNLPLQPFPRWGKKTHPLKKVPEAGSRAKSLVAHRTDLRIGTMWYLAPPGRPGVGNARDTYLPPTRFTRCLLKSRWFSELPGVGWDMWCDVSFLDGQWWINWGR